MNIKTKLFPCACGEISHATIKRNFDDGFVLTIPLYLRGSSNDGVFSKTLKRFLQKSKIKIKNNDWYYLLEKICEVLDKPQVIIRNVIRFFSEQEAELVTMYNENDFSEVASVMSEFFPMLTSVVCDNHSFGTSISFKDTIKIVPRKITALSIGNIIDFFVSGYIDCWLYISKDDDFGIIVTYTTYF